MLGHQPWAWWLHPAAARARLAAPRMATPGRTAPRGTLPYTGGELKTDLAADIKTLLPAETSRSMSIPYEFLMEMEKVSKTPMVIDVLLELERRQMEDFEEMQHRMEELQGRRGVLHRRPAPAGPPARHLRPQARHLQPGW